MRVFASPRILVLHAVLLLGGCAAFSADRGMDAVTEITGDALNKQVVALRSDGDEARAREVIEQLLKRQLTADSAVQIALLNNRELQAAYNALGIAEAARIRASLPPNPGLSVSRLAGGGEIEIERRIVGDILALATLPLRADIATDRYAQAQLQAAQATLRVAFEARRAFYHAVAARELSALLNEARATADTANELARRLGESGAMNKLDQARNQVFAAEVVAQQASARLRAETERERLVRAMGLWGNDLAFRLPGTLPVLPARPRHLAAIEVEAVHQRVDLQVERIEVAALAKSTGLTGATRFLDLLEVAGVSKTTRDAGGTTRGRGFELELEIPLFDLGETRVRQAEDTYMQAVNRLAAKAVIVRSEAREAYQAYRSAYDIARHYRREVLPLRHIISEEVLLRYNAMQIDVFALLTEVRQRITSTTAALEAQRDYWIAETALHAAIVGGGAATSDGGAPMQAASSEPTARH